MLVKSANLTFRQIVRSANREGGEQSYALLPETFSHSTTHSKFRLTRKFLEHTYAP